MASSSSLSWLLSAVAFAVATSCTPGPNNTMLAASGAHYGFRRTLPHMAGVSLGFPLLLALVALGAAKPLYIWPIIHEFMRWFGAAYLVWLSWHIAMAPVSETAPEDETEGLPQTSKPWTFWQGLTFQWINPKAWIIAASALLTYTSPGGNILRQIGVISLVFLAVTPFAVAFWTGIGLGAKRFLHTQRSKKIFNNLMALLLVASIIPLLRD